MLTRIHSATVIGLQAYIITVEVDTSFGLGKHTIVGLPDAAVKESKERIEAAIKNAQLPVSFYKKFTINLAPADLRKEGPAFDVPIALGMLANEELIPLDKLQSVFVLGELSLDGSIRSARGVLSMVIAAKDAGLTHALVPYDNAEEAALVQGITIIPVRHLLEVVEYLQGKIEIDPFQGKTLYEEISVHGDFAEVKGQYAAKRALEIAAAGGHNVLLVGSPGCGKSMLAKRFQSILPELSYEESIEVSKIYSVAGLLRQGLIRQRQFRAPHHTISDVGIVGGGRFPRPGEISLAHLGVLFLDEFAEFDRKVLEVLRQPLENGEITISRAMLALTYPARFILLAAMNPCPCGYAMDRKKQCSCTTAQVASYWKRLSGPILDRIDLIVEVPTLLPEELLNKPHGESSQDIKKRVTHARAIQSARLIDVPGVYTNAALYPRHLKQFAPLTDSATGFLRNALETMDVSARGYDRLIKVARTIADLGQAESITEEHIAEALQYRLSDWHARK